MKLLKVLLFFGLIYVTAGQSLDRPLQSSILPTILERILERGRNILNRQIINIIEGQRENFSTGWPLLGIPPIDPLLIEDVELNLDTLETLNSFSLRLFDAELVGLQEFEIDEMDVSIIGLSAYFEISFRELSLIGQHETSGNLGTTPISGTGSASFIFNDLRVNGTIDMSNVDDGFLNIDKFFLGISVRRVTVRLQGFGIFLDATISTLLSAAFPTLITESQSAINDFINENIVSALNKVLNDFRIIDVINSLINSIFNQLVSCLNLFEQN
ncbi:CLUMA_CG010163, isoform A [Clunio marinus]|uniref:CLUMA_CG010163, isoform A n=1 Tax=Clunio marinus TaxID=568069 RepID=A0A1J1I8D7_9DIPT|nr:CLUMA_CG010163, isoform A [Clunio marinus]